MLSDWIKSKESLDLYLRLIDGLRLRQLPERFALTLTALSCREGLLPYTKDDTARSIGDSYLTDFDAILNGKDISNRRAVFEHMIMSLVRALRTHDIFAELAQFLAETLQQEQSLLGLLDGISDQYCAKKIHGHDHNGAFEEVRNDLVTSTEIFFGRDRTVDANWIMIPRLSLQLNSTT